MEEHSYLKQEEKKILEDYEKNIPIATFHYRYGLHGLTTILEYCRLNNISIREGVIEYYYTHIVHYELLKQDINQTLDILRRIDKYTRFYKTSLSISLFVNIGLVVLLILLLWMKIL